MRRSSAAPARSSNQHHPHDRRSGARGRATRWASSSRPRSDPDRRRRPALPRLRRPLLLPNRMDAPEQLDDRTREYTAVRVTSDSPLHGQTVEEANLRNLPGLFLVEIDRGDRLITPVSPDQILQRGDILVFAGVVSTILDLQRTRGLEPAAGGAAPRLPGGRSRPMVGGRLRLLPADRPDRQAEQFSRGLRRRRDRRPPERRAGRRQDRRHPAPTGGHAPDAVRPGVHGAPPQQPRLLPGERAPGHLGAGLRARPDRLGHPRRDGARGEPRRNPHLDRGLRGGGCADRDTLHQRGGGAGRSRLVGADHDRLRAGRRERDGQVRCRPVRRCWPRPLVGQLGRWPPSSRSALSAS